MTSAVGLTAPTLPAAKAKPNCASPVNPDVAAPTDCSRPHVTNLLPDPGETGRLTIDGIDVDKDGVRDDVQRWIAENWGHSEVAGKGLTTVAQVKLLEMHHGDDLGKAETRRFSPDQIRKAICASHLETRAMLKGRAYDRLKKRSHEHTRAMETVARFWSTVHEEHLNAAQRHARRSVRL